MGDIFDNYVKNRWGDDAAQPNSKNFTPPPNTPDHFDKESAPFQTPGQPQPYPQQQPTRPGQVVTGNAPGFEKERESATDAWNVARNQALGYGMRMFNLDQAIRAQEGLKKQGGSTGPGTETTNMIRSFILANSPEILKKSGILPDEVRTADYNELHKYLTRLYQDTANSLGPHTNQGLTTTMTGSPNTNLDDMSLADLLKSQKALERMQQASTLDFLYSGKAGADYPNYMIGYSTNVDPRAYTLDLLEPDKREQLLKSITPDKQKAFGDNVTLAEKYNLMSAPVQNK